MRRAPHSDLEAFSVVLLVVSIIVATAGVFIIGLMVLSYEDTGIADDYRGSISLGPAIRDGANRSVYYIPIDSQDPSSFAKFDLVVNNMTSSMLLDKMLTPQKAWHVDGLVIYVDDFDHNGVCGRGDKIVITAGDLTDNRTVTICVRNASFGLELSSVTFVIEGVATDQN